MQDFIKIALGVLLSTLLVAFTFKVIKPSTESIGKNLTGMETNMAVMNNEEMAGYSKGSVKGSDVAAAVQLYQDKGIAILIYTKGSAADSYTNYGSLLTTAAADTNIVTGINATFTTDTITQVLKTPAAKSTANLSALSDKIDVAHYVRATADFACRLIKDANGEIIGIAFQQQ